jgi:hypothetical protein
MSYPIIAIIWFAVYVLDYIADGQSSGIYLVVAMLNMVCHEISILELKVTFLQNITPKTEKKHDKE